MNALSKKSIFVREYSAIKYATTYVA